MLERDLVTFVKMKRISRLKVGGDEGCRVADGCLSGLSGQGRDGGGRGQDVEDQADLDKKYAAEVNARLVKLVWTVKAKGFSAKAGSNVQSVLADDRMTPGSNGRFLTSDDGKVNLLVTMVPLLKAWAKKADAGIKSTDDVAVIVDNEAFYPKVFAGDSAAYRLAEPLVKRKLADTVVKALMLWESQDGVPEVQKILSVAVRLGERASVFWWVAAVPGGL